ncbi:MAG: TonB-dependent receptor plug domain-containing protein [Rhodothermales bacterium]|nr:TonB-dependent receptor plug domain-containing protein [Rhodothermales bacterium]
MDLEADAARNVSDVLRIASEVEGVRSGSMYTDLHIQGGESGEHVVLLDGAPIFEPVSLGRFIGSFSPLAVGRVTVHKAGFGARHGSLLSGVVEVDHDLLDTRVDRFSITADPYSLNARASIGKRGGSTPHGLVAVRRSLWETYQAPVLESMIRRWNNSDPLLTATVLSPTEDYSAATPHAHGSDLGFTDVHVAARVPIDIFRSVSFSGYYGESRVATELLSSANTTSIEPRFSLAQDRYRWTNSMAQVRHDWIAGPRWLATAKLRFSEHRLSDRLGLVDSESLALDGTVSEIESELRAALGQRDRDDNTNRFSEGALELRSTVSLSESRQLEVGADVITSGNRFSQQSDFYRSIEIEGINWKVAGFADYELRLGERTQIDLGSRLTYVPTRRTMYAEPRASIRFDDQGRVWDSYAVRLSGGLYRQFVNALDLSNVGPSAIMPFVRLWIPTDRSVTPAQSIHSAVEFLAIPVDGWQLRAEAFSKWIPTFYSIDYAVLLDTSTETPLSEQSSFIEKGDGRAFGFNIGAERSTTRYSASASYSYELNKRVYRSRIGTDRVAAPWSEPHRLTSHLSVFPGSGLSLRTRFHAVFGRTWGFRQSYYDFLAAHNSAEAFPPFNLKEPQSHRPAPIYRVDVGVSYERPVAESIVRLRLDILNVLNRNNVLDWSLQQSGGGSQFEIDRRTLPGIQPVIALEVNL